MALFSLWTGIIYNEFFSMQMSLWGPTRYQCFIGDKAAPDVSVLDCQHQGGEIKMPPGARGGCFYLLFVANHQAVRSIFYC